MSKKKSKISFNQGQDMEEEKKSEEKPEKKSEEKSAEPERDTQEHKEQSKKEAPKQSIEKEYMQHRNPWMYTTIVLMIISIGLLAANLQTTAFIISSVDGGTIQPAPGPAPGPAPAPSVDVAGLASDDPAKGDPNAPITIVEFSDFECPFCGRFYSSTLPQIQTLIDEGKVRFVYRDFPLSFHPQAQPAAEAGECANEQGKFWEFHNLIFENQQSLNDASYKQWAADLGLNTAQFNSCVDSSKYRTEVLEDFAAGQAAGVSGTPTFFINGEKLVGAQPYSAFEAIFNKYL